ncbi:nuclear transport factor 2 family protein, partial [Variovorax paradoxus]|uniref:nuclear transport factor 2 family protein n=1 Tax=Variovorax paradoxus TaxID=34073 RepID=UPI003C6F12C0
PLVSVTGDEARGETAFSVFRTLPGETSLFAVGRYLDELVRVGSGWRFSVHRNWRRVLDALRICRSKCRIPRRCSRANPPDGRLAILNGVLAKPVAVSKRPRLRAR